jgi:hypothetical protein
MHALQEVRPLQMELTDNCYRRRTGTYHLRSVRSAGNGTRHDRSKTWLWLRLWLAHRSE